MKLLSLGLITLILVSCGVSNAKRNEIASALQNYLAEHDYESNITSIDVEKKSGKYIGSAIVSYDLNGSEQEQVIKISASSFLGKYSFDIDEGDLESIEISKNKRDELISELQNYFVRERYNVAVSNIDLKKKSGKYVGYATLSYNLDGLKKTKSLPVSVSSFLGVYSFDFDDKDLESIDPDNWKKQDKSAYAYVLAMDTVKEHLKSPRSAKFPGLLERKDTIYRIGKHEEQVYTIKSWVEAQNSFGTMIRENYTATFQQTGKDRWKLLYFDFVK